MFLFLLPLVATQFSVAQDLSGLMRELSKAEGAIYQVVGKEMMAMSMGASKNTDEASFMQKLDSIEVVVLETYKAEELTRLSETLENIKDGSGYEILLAMKDGKDYVRIISQKEGDIISNLFISAIDDKGIVLVRMSGKLTESDVANIVDEQKKKGGQNG